MPSTTAPRPAAQPAGTTAPASPATAPTRERWVDACRATALTVVVLGHILISVIHRDAVGSMQVTSLLDIASWTHPLTWVVQVMAVFFAVGGYAAAGSVRARGVTDRGSWAAWTARRSAGLLVPALPLLLAWLLAGPVLGQLLPTAGDTALVSVATSAALVPLWFLATYLVVQALVPVWVALTDAGRGVAVLAALLGGVALVDAAHLAGIPGVGYVNFLLVWSLPTLLGVLVHAGWGRGSRHLPLIAVGALVAAVGLVHLAGYSVPVVGVTGSARSNNSPPSLLLALHGLAYAAIVLHLAPRLERHLTTAGRKRALDLLATWSMPVYLWHMTALVLLGAALLNPLGPLDVLATTTPLTSGWWLLRPVMIVTVLLVTLALIAVVAVPTRWMTGTLRPTLRPSPLRVLAGVLGCAAGIGVIVQAGTVVTPWLGVAALATGVALVTTPRARA